MTTPPTILSAPRDHDEPPGLHPVPNLLRCRDPEHGIPTHLYVPGGMKFVHYCKTCGHKSVAYGSLAEF